MYAAASPGCGLPQGRYRSLSLEESGQADAPPEFSNGDGSSTRPRRRLNTYLSSKDYLPTQRSLEETADEDGANDGPFSESLPSSSVSLSAQQTNVISRSEVAFFNFLQRHPCYELMQHSSKLVVFDTRLCGRKAFFAMMHNGVSAALLWNTEKQTFVGVLTVCDFIRAVCHQYTDGGPVLEEQCIESWLQFDNERRRIVAVGPEDSLARAGNVLLSSRIRRLPVCDPATGNMLFMIAHKHIVRLVYANLSRLLKPRSWFHQLKDLGIGTFDNLATATPETKIFDALKLLVDKRVSALPVVSSTDGHLLGVFSRTDSLILAVDKGYMNLDRPLLNILPHLAEDAPRRGSPVRICSMDDTLGTIVERIVRGCVHRLIVVDPSRKVIGVVSLSDLLRFFLRPPVLYQPGVMASTSVTNANEIDGQASQPSIDSGAVFAPPDSTTALSPGFADFAARHSATSSISAQTSDLQVPLTPVYNNKNGNRGDVVSASLPACSGRHLNTAEMPS